MNHIRIEVPGTGVGRPYDDAEPVRHAAGSTVPSLVHLFGAVASEFRTSEPRRKERVPSGLAPWQMLRVRDYVESALSGAIDVACLARIAKLSASHFARAFRTSFGATPAAYVVVRRVERAKSMMLETSEPLCRISLDCGFTDQSHLSRAFRREVGLSPSQWRRRHRLA